MPFQARMVVTTCLVGILLSLGCGVQYQVELEPEGDTLHRKLTISSRESKAPSQDELRRLEGVYGQAPDRPDGDYRFEGSFQRETPSDVGGAGEYEYFDSPFGSLGIYVERFRGRDDAVTELHERFEMIDQIIEHLIGWSVGEFDDPELQQRVQRFLNEDLRPDLKNLCVYLYIHQAWTNGANEDEHWEQFGHRLLQFLTERGYLTLRDLPRIQRAYTGKSPELAGQLIHEAAQRKLARNSGDAPVPMVEAIRDPEKLQQSVREYFRGTAEYEVRLNAWRIRPDPQDGDEPPDPTTILGEMVMRAFLPGVFGPDSLELSMALEHPPHITNGEWEADAKLISWSRTLPNEHGHPLVIYAQWVKPDTKEQQRILGDVLLTDRNLAEYILWYHGLSDNEREVWDKELRDWGPKTWKGKLQRFSFPDSPELVETPRNLLGSDN